MTTMQLSAALSLTMILARNPASSWAFVSTPQAISERVYDSALRQHQSATHLSRYGKTKEGNGTTPQHSDIRKFRCSDDASLAITEMGDHWLQHTISPAVEHTVPSLCVNIEGVGPDFDRTAILVKHTQCVEIAGFFLLCCNESFTVTPVPWVASVL